jgi:hypothetical protein
MPPPISTCRASTSVPQSPSMRLSDLRLLKGSFSTTAMRCSRAIPNWKSGLRCRHSGRKLSALMYLVPQSRYTVVVRTFQPHIVFAFNPFPNLNCPPLTASFPRGWDDMGYHPDHMQAGKIAFETGE